MEPNKGFASRDDELLSALLDGELDDAAADALTERLAREPQLATRLEALRGTDDSVRALFAKVDELPMPQGVQDLLAANSASEAPPTAEIIPFPRRVIERFANAPVAIAASLALAAGFLADRLFETAPQPQAGINALQARTVPQDSAIYELLENGASGAAVELPDGASGRVVLTFADESGDWCRQLRIDSNSAAVQALTCRRNGNWQNEVVAFGEPASAGYQQASGASMAVISNAVDTLIGDREPLDVDSEIAVIERQWIQKP